MSYQLTRLTSDVCFGEAPRWREGKLWFSDIRGHRVKTVDLSGLVETILETDFEPSGLGWLLDGSMVVVSMIDHCVMRYDGEALTKLADVSHLSGGKLNDMVVDQFGHIYMSNLGYDYEKGEERVTTNIVRVDADGSSQAATPGVLCPNGMAITADGKTLIVGQSASAEVLGFDLAKDGTVSNRQVYAELPEGRIADGICVDAEGAVWVASPITKEFVRIKKGGEVTDIISTGERHAIACMLGGEDRKTLFCMTSAGIHLSASPEVLEGAIEIATVDVPGAGWP